jgi:hypothetical protein
VGAKTIYTDNSSYATAIAGVVGPPATGMTAVAPELTFGVAASTVAAPIVSVMTTPTATLWAEARMSASGTCYGMRETSTNGTYYISALGTCTGDAASTDVTVVRSFT